MTFPRRFAAESTRRPVEPRHGEVGFRGVPRRAGVRRRALAWARTDRRAGLRLQACHFFRERSWPFVVVVLGKERLRTQTSVVRTRGRWRAPRRSTASRASVSCWSPSRAFSTIFGWRFLPSQLQLGVLVVLVRGRLRRLFHALDEISVPQLSVISPGSVQVDCNRSRVSRDA